MISDTKFLPEGKDDPVIDRIYKIPRYQRHYDWAEDNVTNLFKDIGEAVEIKRPHYTGSFLLTDTRPINVIDGQQRMTTTFLLLKGFQLVCEAKEIKDKINTIFFTDPSHCDGDHLRLVVSDQDKDIFNKIICSRKIDSIQNNGSKMYANFKLGYDYFSELRKNYTDEEIYNLGFGSLQICELIIQEDVDDEPQKIFRDLNSKGQPLKNSDLIRNYLLMTEEELYDEYWHDIELMFTDRVKNEFQSDLFEEFIFNYVLLKKSDQINENKIFNAYVSYCENPDGEFCENGVFAREKAVKDLSEYAIIYKLFLNLNVYDVEEKKYKDTINLLKELRDMDQTTPYPFLMRVCKDERNGDIDVATLNKVINLIIVYYIRAIVCQIRSGSRRGYLLSMYKSIFEIIPENKNISTYYKAVYKYIHEQGKGSKMPTEKEFLKRLEAFDLYQNKAVCRCVLKVIVNNRYPNEFHEKTIVERPTIEHLLPQTPDEKWKRELGGAKNLKAALDYVHTIGNLSLANQEKNSELGNKSRKEKADILQKYGEALAVLNKEFIELKGNFSLDFIKKRAKKLISIVKERYYLDEVKTEGIYFDKFDFVKGQAEWADTLKGRVPTYVEIDEEAIPVNSFWDVGFAIYKYLGFNYADELQSLIDKNITYCGHSIISATKLKNCYEIPETNLFFHYESGGDCYFSACKVAEAVGVSLNKIRLLLRRQNIDPKSLMFDAVDDLSPYELGEKFALTRKGSGVYAYGHYVNGKMIVLKNSTIGKESKPYFNERYVKLREELLRQGAVDEDFKLLKNIVFISPSAASNAILGYISNGKTEWVLVADGKTKLGTYIAQI